MNVDVGAGVGCLFSKGYLVLAIARLTFSIDALPEPDLKRLRC